MVCILWQMPLEIRSVVFLVLLDNICFRGGQPADLQIAATGEGISPRTYDADDQILEARPLQIAFWQ
jgi:hypothetical protein